MSLVVERLALLVGQLVAADVEARAAVAAVGAVDLARPHPVVDAAVHLVPAHRLLLAAPDGDSHGCGGRTHARAPRSGQ